MPRSRTCCKPNWASSSPKKGAGYEVSEPVDSELLPSKTAIGIRKGNTELKELLNKGIKALHDDGTYAEIQKKHFGELNLYSGK